MRHVAAACGLVVEFDSLGSYIHKDDLPTVQIFLDVTDACMRQLFEESELPKTVPPRRGL